MKIFLDTNILLDFVTRREPASSEALQIFKNGKDGHYSMLMASFSIVDTVYILKKTYKLKRVTTVIEAALAYLILLPTSHKAIKESLSSDFSDFEDAVQYYTALEHGKIDCIITRDTKGFAKSEIPVLTPYQFVSKHLKK